MEKVNAKLYSLKIQKQQLLPSPLLSLTLPSLLSQLSISSLSLSSLSSSQSALLSQLSSRSASLNTLELAWEKELLLTKDSQLLFQEIAVLTKEIQAEFGLERKEWQGDGQWEIRLEEVLKDDEQKDEEVKKMQLELQNLEK